MGQLRFKIMNSNGFIMINQLGRNYFFHSGQKYFFRLHYNFFYKLSKRVFWVDQRKWTLHSVTDVFLPYSPANLTWYST